MPSNLMLFVVLSEQLPDEQHLFQEKQAVALCKNDILENKQNSAM